MPDRITDEETETRWQSLCLFGVAGITRTNNRRCENCPGAPRTPLYHQKRCPLDSLEYNLFSPTHSGEEKSEIDLKLLASSSKALQPDEDGVDIISNELGDCSLDGSTGRKSGQRSRSVTDDPHSELIGVKRKAEQPESSSRNEQADPLEDEFTGIHSIKHLKLSQDPQGTEAFVDGFTSLSLAPNKASVSHTQEKDHSVIESSISVSCDEIAKAADISSNQTKVFLSAASAKIDSTVEVSGRAKSKGDQLDGRSDVEKWVRNKPQRIFEDTPQGGEPHFVEESWVFKVSIPASSTDANPNIMEGDHHSRICFPGIGMITERQGVPSCSDRIFNRNDNKEYGLMGEMEIVDLSIDQIEDQSRDERFSS
ncbi:hypothetical protein M758_5G102300 [Ceratodon purpureus]|nr:hypothetical protein M758_5G102300 [Ceratodon purpureus]